MKVWTPLQEAERLAVRFATVNRAEFARIHKVPGGAAMIYQHLQGLRPISMEAAIAYARGFRVHLADISPRLANVAMEALGVDQAGQQRGELPAPDKFAELHRLSPECQQAILILARAMLPQSTKRTSKAKAPATVG